MLFSHDTKSSINFFGVTTDVARTVMAVLFVREMKCFCEMELNFRFKIQASIV